jgi:PAS domain S-box-containing protein
MGVEPYADHLDAPAILAALLDEFSAVRDYCTLRDNLPQRLAGLLQCRCILLYQLVGETLQFASGSFADLPGWSSTLLTVAHVNPIEFSSDLPEAQVWRTHRAQFAPLEGVERALACAPLIYRQRTVGVLTALRSVPDLKGEADRSSGEWASWWLEELPLITVVASVVAMLLENTRLLERDRARIHELSLLNSITSQMNCSLRERTRVQRIVVQRTKEISSVDLCEVLLSETNVVEADNFWLPLELRNLLWQRWQSNERSTPLILERIGELQASDYMGCLSPSIKTFFAVPLIGKCGKCHMRDGALPYLPCDGEDQSAQVLGMIAGAYYKPWKLRREELVLVQILANQASTVLENIALMDDVVEARNEARCLLRQVLDDQRLKELILESIPSGLITVDMYGRMTTFNRAAEVVLGYHPLEIMGQPIHKVLELRSLESVLQTGQAQHETLLMSGRQGQEIALDVALAPLRDDRGKQIGALATFSDITTMHHLEEEKRRLDRLASLGAMSASVAHEVRNPLASIKTSMQMLQDDLKAELEMDKGIQEEIAVVLKEVERLDTIVHDLLLFSRPRHLHLAECDIGDLSKRLLHFLQPQCEERGVRVRLVLQDMPPAHIDAAQMEQVLMNLFLNALQAMPNGGVLSVSCQIVHINASQSVPDPNPGFPHTSLLEANLPTSSQEGQRDQRTWLELTVSDTGIGIAPDHLAHIFQPFYTTKAHGIGLGLPITRRLIEDHHGHIFVESQLGYGTTVSVRLPI